MAEGRGFRIPVRAQLEQFQRDLKSMKAIGERAGQETADGILKELRNELRKRQGALKEAVAAGVVDKDQARKIGQDFAREFNSGILAALKSLRKAGKDNTEEFTRLQRALRNVGTSGARSGQQIKRGFVDNLKNLPGFVRGALATGLLGSFLFVSNAIIGVFKNMVSKIRETIERAGAVQALGESFETLAFARGLDPTDTIEALRRGTRGLAADLDLMRQANFALQSGLPVTEESLGNLAETARRLARATGRDATEAFERLVNGIVKGEQNVLEELGLFTRLTDVLKQYTRETGKNADALTQQQKIMLFYNAVMEEAETKVTALGQETLTAGERLGQFTIFMTNLRDRTAEAIVEIPKIAGFLDSIGTSAENATAKVQDFADTLAAILATIIQSDAADLFGKILGAEVKAGIATARVTGGLFGISPEAIARNKEIIQLRREITEEQKRLNAALGAQPVVAGGLSDEERRKQAEELAKALKEQATAAGQLATALVQVRAEAEAAAQVGLVEGVQFPPSVVAQLKEVVALEQRLTQLRELRATAGAQAGPTADADIAREQARLDTLKQSVADSLGDLKTRLNEIPAVAASMANSIGNAFAQIEPQVRSVVGEIAAVEAAQAELQRAILTGDEARQQAATASLRDRENELRRAVSSMVTALERAGIPAELLDSLIADINKGLASVNVVAEPAADAIESGFAEAARSAELLLRGLLSVADAIGGISDNTRQALTGLIDLAAGLAQLKAAETTLGTLGGIGAVAGAAIGIGAALFGGDDQEREERKAREENLRQIQSMTDDLAKLNAVIGPLVSAVEQAERALAAIADRAGITGVGGVADARSRREELLSVRASAEARLADRPGKAERDFFKAVIADIDAQLAILDAALDAFGDSLEQLRANFDEELTLREARLDLSGPELDALQREIEFTKQLNDAIAAFGEDDPRIERLRQVQERERERAIAEEAERERRAIEDAGIRRLEAEGLTRTAALRRLLIDQERALAAARERGASAAELAAMEEANLAEQRQFVENFINDIVRNAAVRRGDTATVIALDQAAVLKSFADAQTALEELRDAGLITEDQFLHMSDILRDELGPAMEAVADAALAAARALVTEIDQGIEDFLDPEGAPARDIQRRADKFREEARDTLSGAELDEVLAKIDEWQRLALEAIQNGQTVDGIGGGAGGAGATETVRSLQGLSETTGLSFVAFQRQAWEELKLIRVATMDTAAILRRSGGLQTSGLMPAGRTSTSMSGPSISIGRVMVDLPGVRSFDPSTASMTGRLVTREFVRQLMPHLEREFGERVQFHYRGTGAQER